MKRLETRPRIALMSYAMDNRVAKGTALYTERLLEKLIQDKNYDFYLVHYEKVDHPIYKNTKEIIIPCLPFKLPYGTRFIRQMLFYWKFRNDKFDIIHWFQPRAYPFFWLAPTKKIVITFHAAGDITAPAFFDFAKLVFNFTLKHFNKHVDAIIAVSQYAKQEIITHYKASPGKVFVTYNGGGELYSALNKSDARRVVSDKYNIQNPFILDISRLQPHKNVDRLIEAYILMRDNFPEREELLVIVGKPVFGSEYTHTLAENSNYHNDIIFVDYVDQKDLNSLYSASELFVFPSLNEGFGLPVVEAMASGTPVITSNLTSLPEIAGDSAVVIDPYNIEEMSIVMNKILSNADLYNTYVEMGINRSKVFTWDETIKKTKDIYQRVLSSQY